MPDRAAEPIPTILFGAFDRHNFGDLLFPHVVAAMLGDRPLVFAGLLGRDLRDRGGHAVRAIGDLAADFRGRPVNLLHVGGELLTCDAWQAAVMLQPPAAAATIVARLDDHPAERLEWARRTLGTASRAPYCLARDAFPRAASVIYNAVGGTELDRADPELRAAVLESLRTADQVSVRDTRTLAALEAEGIFPRLVPDPAVMVAELFGERIGRDAATGEVADLCAAFPNGYLAVQFSADFGDDKTLHTLAAQLRRAAAEAGLAVVLFRAGAAPWHDELACYERLVAHMRGLPTRILTSLDVWDICALVSHSRAYLGSSLHGRILATAYALPRVSLVHPAFGTTPGKLAAFAATWDTDDMPTTVCAEDVADAVLRVLAGDAAARTRMAVRLAGGYRSGFQAVRSALR